MRNLILRTLTARKGRAYALLLATCLLAISPEIHGRETDLRGYNSQDGALEDIYQTGREETVYTLQQLESLRQAIKPRFVRVLNYRHYANSREYLEKGILFTFEGYRSERVFLAGDFNNWRPVPMFRNRMGVYYYILPVREIEKGERVDMYRYKFQVDGIWTHDPTHRTREDDGLGGYISHYYLENPDINRTITVRILDEKEDLPERLVEFAIYLPEVDNLSLVGSFNNWNPEHDLMIKGEDGIFRLRKRMRPGDYVYKYVADGKWILDRYNESTRYASDIQELCSYLEIE
ncbi:MAG: glycogen-binding domain-containing protein [Leptospiraceae bacterium]|nr:glycogen-binding domain-containing protein [Leptospiraceae bacterium]MCB1314434.1 glycogen-binding domain-containing protein [Leptospiraceae bacterium]